MQEMLSYFQRMENNLMLPIPAAVLLKDRLVFRVQLIAFGTLKLRIYVLSPFIAQI
jgi:hypothetical protein